MTLEQISSIGDVALEIVHPLQDFLLEDIFRRIAKAGKITNTAMYQIYRAKALGTADETIKAAIKKQNKLSSKSIAELFQYLTNNLKQYDSDGSIRQLIHGYIEAATNQAGKLLGKLGVVVPTGEVVPIGEAYAQTMDFAFKKVFSGATDYTTALRQATGKLAKSGVRYITSPGGRTVGIEYATRQTLMTQMGELNKVVLQKNHDALNCNGWEISAHAACAEDHEPIQGRIFSDTEYEKINKGLKRPIGYFNCGHWAMPINTESISPQYTEAQLAQMREDNANGVYYQSKHYTKYEAGRQRRATENSIRETRNSVLADKILGDNAKLAQDQIHLIRLQEEYKRFCGATDLLTQNERLQVAGFGHSEATAARAAFRRLTY